MLLGVISAGLLGFFDDRELPLLLSWEVNPAGPVSVDVLAGDNC